MTSLSFLYRDYLRHVKRLPLHYLRLFFQIKASDDFRAIADTPARKPLLRKQKIKRVSRDLRKIQLALSGRDRAFSYILDLAYGRKGKLRWELMEPILTQSKSLPPKPIIPSVPTSLPPVYSPELRVLLTNSSSRERPLELHQLKFPPTLSPRANPKSEEARLLGPLSKRLELNTRWRYFNREWKKVYPPLEVIIKKKDETFSTNATDVSTAGATALGFQDQGLLDGIIHMLGPPAAPSPVTRREHRYSNVELPPPTQRHPSRWLRRRYQDLLGRLPLLAYNTTNKVPSFNVGLSLNATMPSGRSSAHRRRELDPVNLAWFELSEATKPQSRKKVRMLLRNWNECLKIDSDLVKVDIMQRVGMNCE